MKNETKLNLSFLQKKLDELEKKDMNATRGGKSVCDDGCDRQCEDSFINPYGSIFDNILLPEAYCECASIWVIIGLTI